MPLDPRAIDSFRKAPAAGGVTGYVLVDQGPDAADPAIVRVDLADILGAGGVSVNSVFGRSGAVAAQPGDYNAEQITETALAKIMTAAERDHLTNIEPGATADQTAAEIAGGYNVMVARVSGAERIAGTETADRRFSPEDIATMASLHGGGGAGATNLSVGTHDATQLVVASDTGTDATLPLATAPSGTNRAGLLSPAEKDKLAGVEAGATADQTSAEIAAGYNAQVPQVSGGERTAGTETAVRRFSPEDIATMAGIHGGGIGGSSSGVIITEGEGSLSAPMTITFVEGTSL